MIQNIALSELPPLHLYLSYIVQLLVAKEECLEIDVIESQLSNTYIKSATVEKNFLTVTLEYDTNKTDILNLISPSNFTTKNFFILCTHTDLPSSKTELSFNIISKDSNNLIYKLLHVTDTSLDKIINNYFNMHSDINLTFDEIITLLKLGNAYKIFNKKIFDESKRLQFIQNICKNLSSQNDLKAIIVNFIISENISLTTLVNDMQYFEKNIKQGTLISWGVNYSSNINDIQNTLSVIAITRTLS